MSAPVHSSELPPGASPPASRVARALKRPIDRFLQLEAASGILLLVAASAALLWANSPWAASYEALSQTPIHLGAADWTFDVTVHFVINDVLMAVFFFAVGLEIRRELHSGELRDPRRAALPVFAALGGMLVPAAIYLALNRGALARGWGIPMATDIAFAVGVLTLLGSRVAPSMRVFLLALAIIDDIGAILVIAISYSTELHLDGLVLALLGIGGIVGLQRLGAHHSLIYAIPAVAIWLGMYRAGVHPTIAGVIVGLLTPAVSWYGLQQFIEPAGGDIRSMAEQDPAQPTGAYFAEQMRRLRRAQRYLSSPVERLEHAVHPWVAFFIMPLFAFANAGVDVAGVQLATTPTLVFGIAAGLLIGKPVGILVASGLAVRLRLASLPRGLTWRGVAVVGAVAGIGFTMALFVAELAFAERTELHGTAKLVVLLSSATAAGAALLLGRGLLARDPAQTSVRSPKQTPKQTPKQRRRRFIPELERGPLAYVLLVVGVVCAALELADPDRIHGRLVLFVLAGAAGIFGILHRKRAS